MKYYRVKWGYGADDFYSVSENEVGRAIKAQGEGTVFACSEGTISGNNIMAIMPDYNRALGYNRDYHLTGEDYAELPSGAQKAHTEFLEETKREALGLPNHYQLTDGI